MPLELSKTKKATKARKSTKQTLLIKLCPFMSRRITHPGYRVYDDQTDDVEDGGSIQELVRQPCVESDCAVWDLGYGCCSLSATSRARELVGEAYRGRVEVNLHELKPSPKVKPEKPRKRPTHYRA